MRPLSAILLLLAAAASADEAKESSEKEVKRLAVPEKLTPKGKAVLFLLRAEGAQVYRAEKKGDDLVWAFQEPDAVLLDFSSGDKVGTHGKGPLWADGDGGKVTAKLVESARAPSPAAVPWLLLEVTGKPTGRFDKVTHVQRIDTWGGLPPTAKPKKEGETKKVRYHATYAFWGDR
jgi:hypothetical protein